MLVRVTQDMSSVSKAESAKLDDNRLFMVCNPVKKKP